MLVGESGTGRLLRIGLADGWTVPVASNLGAVRSVAVGPDGSVAVLDSQRGRVLRVEPAAGCSTVVAQDLAVGDLQKPYPRSSGIAIGSDNAIYVAADVENAVHRIRKA